MPTYSFRDKRTDAEFDKMMMISELDQYLTDNPHIEQIIIILSNSVSVLLSRNENVGIIQ